MTKLCANRKEGATEIINYQKTPKSSLLQRKRKNHTRKKVLSHMQRRIQQEIQ